MSDGYKRTHESGFNKRKTKEKRNLSISKYKYKQIKMLNKNELINIITPESKIENELLSPMKTEPKLTTSLNVNTSAITESITDNVKSNPTNLIHLKFSNDPAQFGTKTRYFRKEYFSRVLGNGECVNREWLIYSPSTGSVYCYVCKIFRHLQISDLINICASI